MTTAAYGSGDTSKRRGRRVHERSRIALFDVFRHAFEHRDAKLPSSSARAGPEAEAQLALRGQARRIGVDEETLRAHVHDHVAVLMNTVRLGSVVSLDDHPEVAQSVLNFGFQDLSNLTRDEMTSQVLIQSLTRSLADHEPRLIPESIVVRVETMEGDAEQRVSVHVSADLIADPADIPIEFEADVDAGAGKVILASSRV